MSHFVACHETCGVAHQAVGQFGRACGRIGGTGLHHNPFAQERHHVVPPDDVGFYDFACARVNGGWPHGVRLGRGGIGEHRVFQVVAFGSHAVGVFFHSDGIFESGFFECYVPVQDAFADVWPQLFGRGGVEVEHDGLLGLDEFTAQISAFVGGFQSPAGDVLLGLEFLLAVGITQAFGGEIDHTVADFAAGHGSLRKQAERGTDHYGDVHFAHAFPHDSGELGRAHDVALESLDVQYP